MKSIGIQVIQPKTDLAPEGVKDAIIDRISNNASDTKGLSISVVRFPRGIRRSWSSHAQDQYAWIIAGKGIIASKEGETGLHPGEHETPARGVRRGSDGPALDNWGYRAPWNTRRPLSEE
jgi:quercetin dioxygenase-like cupin family protein